MMEMMDIQKVTPSEIDKIIETRKPLGMFYCKIETGYVGVDNRTGDAWTEDFNSLSSCKRWLKE
jgi:hypothetical protein